MENHKTTTHWKRWLTAAALGVLLAILWVEVAEGGGPVAKMLSSLSPFHSEWIVAAAGVIAIFSAIYGYLAWAGRR